MNRSKLLLVPFLFLMLMGFANAVSIGGGGTLIYTDTIVAGTIYQNTNSIPMILYGSIGGQKTVLGTHETVWIGNTPTFTTANFILVYNGVLQSNVIGNTLEFERTIPGFFYFSVNNFGGSYNSFEIEYMGTVNAINVNANVIGGIITGTTVSASTALVGPVAGLNSIGASTISGTTISAITLNGNYIPATANGVIFDLTTNTLEVASGAGTSNTAGVVSATGSSGVTSINGQTGAISLVSNGATTISNSGGIINVNTFITGGTNIGVATNVVSLNPNIVVTQAISNVLISNTLNANVVLFPNSNSIAWVGNVPYFIPTALTATTPLGWTGNSVGCVVTCVTSISAGTGIAVSGGSSVLISNLGVISLAGSGGFTPLQSNGAVTGYSTTYSFNSPLIYNSVSNVVYLGYNTPALGLDSTGNLLVTNSVYNFAAPLTLTGFNNVGCTACTGGGGGGIIYTFNPPLSVNSVTNTVSLSYNSPGLIVNGSGSLTAQSPKGTDGVFLLSAGIGILFTIYSFYVLETDSKKRLAKNRGRSYE